jgi:hypothetical protein
MILRKGRLHDTGRFIEAPGMNSLYPELLAHIEIAAVDLIPISSRFSDCTAIVEFLLYILEDAINNGGHKLQKTLKVLTGAESSSRLCTFVPP